MKWKEENNCIPEEILQQFVDGELGQKQTEIIKEHLSSCDKCKSVIHTKRLIISELNKALNFGDAYKIEIPEFEEKNIKTVGFHKTTTLFWWSAAAVILLIISVFLLKNPGKNEVNLEYVFQEMNNEVDANKPWHEQTTTIYILNESGEIIDKIENL